jgi:hypothetical protein
MDNRRFRFLKNMHLRGFVPAHALQREESEVPYWRRQADLTRFHPAPLRREVKLFMIDRPRDRGAACHGRARKPEAKRESPSPQRCGPPNLLLKSALCAKIRSAGT